MSQDFYARIVELTPRLEKMAAVYSQGTVETAEDLYQKSVLHLIERQAANTSFAEQNDSYILDAARKGVCWPTVRRAAIEQKYTTGEPEPVDGEDGSDYFFDTVASPEVSPEVACLNLEQAVALADAIRQLSKREKAVVALAVKGVPTGQIAAQFDITPAAVSVYKRRVADKLHWAVA